MKKKFMRPIVLILALCMCVGLLSGCGSSGGQVRTDHDMPDDLNDTTMTDPGGTEPGSSEQGTEPVTDGSGEPSVTPGGEEIPVGPGDGTDDQQVPGGSEPSGDGETLPVGTDDEGIPTLSIPEGADVVEEIVNLERAIPVMEEMGIPSHPGTYMNSNDYAWIDYSNKDQGYVMASYTAQTSARIKCIVKGPSTSYNYNLEVGEEAALPLSDGNGSYTVTVYQNVSGNKYASVLSQTFDVRMTDMFGPFLYSNQYVDFANAPNTVLKAMSLCSGKTDPLDKVSAVYDFVVRNVSYDMDKAQNVQSGYLPVLDTVLESGKGICFDYAALMTGMLRSQNVPCKLVFGYAGGVYHAWISVWSDEMGWVEGFVYFDDITWQRMDPTFDSNGGGSQNIRDFIGNGSNYSVKYLY